MLCIKYQYFTYCIYATANTMYRRENWYTRTIYCWIQGCHPRQVCSAGVYFQTNIRPLYVLPGNMSYGQLLLSFPKFTGGTPKSYERKASVDEHMSRTLSIGPYTSYPYELNFNNLADHGSGQIIELTIMMTVLTQCGERFSKTRQFTEYIQAECFSRFFFTSIVD
jgi:hypothetical protein